MAEQKGFLKNRKGEGIAALILGFLEVLALSMYYRDSLSFWLQSAGSSLLFFGLWALSAVLIFLFFVLLQLLFRPRSILKDGPAERSFFLDRHPFLVSALVLMVCYLPWVVVFYPGSAIYDMTYQIVQGAGFVPINAHHPIFSTLVTGLLARLSLALTGRLNLGIFLYILLQSSVCVLCFSYMLSFLSRCGARRGFFLSVLGFLALVPLFGGAMQCGTKDTLFTGLFTAFLTLSARLLLGEGRSFRVREWILYGVLTVLLCLFRNAIWIILAPCLLVFFLLVRKERRVRRTLALTGCAALLAAVLFQSVSVRILHTGTETGEMLSIPFQQTARYVRDREEEVTSEEAEVLEMTFVLEDFRQLGTLYYPMSSDPVKARYHWWASEEEGIVLKDYFRIWSGMLKKHPLTFLEATVANTYGYYAVTPVIRNQKGGAGTTVQFFPDRLAVQNVVDASGGTLSKDLIPESPKTLQKAQEALSSWYYFWLKVPVLDLFFKCGIYFYLVLSIVLFYGKRRNRLSWLALPMFLLYLMAIASPVNEHIRYVLPVCAAWPALLAGAARHSQKPGP